MRKKQLKEIILYLIMGGLTTVVNFVVFSLLSRFWGFERWYFSNLPAIIAAILFAYVTNRLFVFHSQRKIFPELIQFFISRVFISIIFEYLAMYLLYNLLELKYIVSLFSISIPLAKILSQVMVIAGNYVISKFWIFKQQNLETKK